MGPNKFCQLSFVLMLLSSLGPLGSSSSDGRSLLVSFHAGGVIPSLTYRKGKTFADVTLSVSKGGGNSACNENNADRGAPARQGAGSYPAPTSAVPSRQKRGGLNLLDQFEVGFDALDLGVQLGQNAVVVGNGREIGTYAEVELDLGLRT